MHVYLVNYLKTLRLFLIYLFYCVIYRLIRNRVCYKLASEPGWSCSDQNPVNYLLYSNGILSYLRYLLCCFVVVLTCCLVLLIRREMADGNGRNDDVIAAALTAVAQALAQNQGNGGHGQEDQGEAEERRLDLFMRNKPPTFKGRFDPEGALTCRWSSRWCYCCRC